MMKPLILCSTLCLQLLLSSCMDQKQPKQATPSPAKMKALIIDGENNHGTWPKTTAMLKAYLEQTDLFSVDVARKKYTWQGPHADEYIGEAGRLALMDQYPVENMDQYTQVEDPRIDTTWSPDFSHYDLVVSNLGWNASPWRQHTMR